MPEVEVVLFTAYADIQLAVEGMKRGAFDFIVKPWDNEKLVATLTAARDKARKAMGRDSSGSALRMTAGCHSERSEESNGTGHPDRFFGRQWLPQNDKRFRDAEGCQRCRGGKDGPGGCSALGRQYFRRRQGPGHQQTHIVCKNEEIRALMSF